jgi:hypothetical protein
MIFWAANPSTFPIQLQKKQKWQRKELPLVVFSFAHFSKLSSIIKKKSKLI